jgi:hypothetical protein
MDTLVGIVADPSQPAVARERAFGRLVVDAAAPRLAVLAAVTAARPVPRAA